MFSKVKTDKIIVYVFLCVCVYIINLEQLSRLLIIYKCYI